MATTIRELVAKLGVDADDRGLKRFDKGLDRIKSRMISGLDIASNFTIVLGGLQKVASAGGRFAGILGDFEQLRVQLATVAKELDPELLFKQLTQFSARTPFQLDKITEAFIRMQATGLKPTIEDMTAVGDFAAAFGKDITEFGEAVVAATTGEMERLKQFGIVARQEGDKVTFIFDGQKKTIKKDSQEIKKFLLDLSRTKYAGAMEKQANTIKGAFSTLIDNVKLFVFEIGERGATKEISKFIQKMTKLAQRARSAAPAIGDRLAKAIEKAGNQLPVVIDNLERGADAVVRFVDKIGGIEQVVKILEGLAAAVVGLKVLAVIGPLVPLVEVLIGLFSGVGIAALGQFALVLAGVVAQFALLFLVGQDIITFLRGGDSALGRFLERFRESDGVLGDVIALVDSLIDVGTELFEIIFPFIEAAAKNAFAGIKLQLSILVALFQSLVIPTIRFFLQLFTIGLRNGVAWIKTFRKVFEAEFGPIQAIAEQFSETMGGIFATLQGAVEGPGTVQLGAGLATQSAAVAPSPAAAGAAAGGAAGGVTANVGGDTNTFNIDARGMDEERLADTLDKKLEERDKRKARQTRERFRGREA